MILRPILSIAALLAGFAVIATIACGSNDSASPSAPSTNMSALSMTVAGDSDSDSKSDDKSKDGRSRDGTEDNFSNDNKSNDGSKSNDGDSSGDGNSFNRASGGFDGINFRAMVQSWSPTCPRGLVEPCLILVLKNVPVTVVNETEIWDFRDPTRPQITIEQFQAVLESSGGAVDVKGEGLPLDDLDGVSLDGDDVSVDLFVAIEVDILP